MSRHGSPGVVQGASATERPGETGLGAARAYTDYDHTGKKVMSCGDLARRYAQDSALVEQSVSRSDHALGALAVSEETGPQGRVAAGGLLIASGPWR